MKNGKYTARRISGTKVFALLLSLVLVLGCAIGGTLAWLTAETQTVTNTFTVGDINIELKEHVYDPVQNEHIAATTTTGNDNYKMVPGYVLPKDPFVTVKADSEDCYVFVKVEKSDNFDTFMSYEIHTDWKQLKDDKNKDVEGVYYLIQDTNAKDKIHYILSGCAEGQATCGVVTVKHTVTKTQLEAAKESKPTISFTAYAIQKRMSSDDTFTAYEAWQIVSKTDSST